MMRREGDREKEKVRDREKYYKPPILITNHQYFQYYRSLLQKRPIKRRYSAKETYNMKEPTNHSHPIPKHLPTLLVVCNDG